MALDLDVEAFELEVRVKLVSRLEGVATLVASPHSGALSFEVMMQVAERVLLGSMVAVGIISRILRLSIRGCCNVGNGADIFIIKSDLTRVSLQLALEMLSLVDVAKHRLENL